MTTASESRSEKATEADRQAFYSALAAEERARQIQNWLQANPSIGALNNGTFYRIVNGQAVAVEPLETI